MSRDQNKNNNAGLISVVALIVVLGVGLFMMKMSDHGTGEAPAMRNDAQAEASNVGGAYTQGAKYFLTAGSGVATQAGSTEATTTKVFLTTADTASSTITGILNRADQIDLNLRAIGSTTAATLQFAIDTSDNGIDWYPIEEATTTTQLPYAHTSGQIQHAWGLSTSSLPICATNEVCKHFSLKGVYANYFRIRFSVYGANAAVYGYAVPREIIPN